MRVRFGYSRVAGIAVGLGAFLLSLPANALHLHFEDFLGQISATSLFLALIVGLVTGEALRIAYRRIAAEPLAIAVGAGISGLIFGGLAALHIDIATWLIGIVQPLVSVGDTLPGAFDRRLPADALLVGGHPRARRVGGGHDAGRTCARSMATPRRCSTTSIRPTSSP